MQLSALRLHSSPPAKPRALMPPRVCHIGHATAQWMEIRRSMAQRNIEVCDVIHVDRLLERYAPQFPALIIVSESEEAQSLHEVCGGIRRDGYTGPMLAITGVNDPVDSILALESGADACVPMDADPRTAVAQIRALLRWSDNSATALRPSDNTPDLPLDMLRVGDCVLHANSRECEIGGELVKLSGGEFQLLWLLAARAGTVMTREELTSALRQNGAHPSRRSIDCYVARLRKQLGSAGKHIKTIRSTGYLLSKRFLVDSSLQ